MSTSRFCHSGEPQNEHKRKRNDRQILGSCQKNKKVGNMKVTVIPIIVKTPRTDPKDLENGLEPL